MPSNKNFYDGSVFLNDQVDTIDLSGWIDRKSSDNYSAGSTEIRFNSDVTSLISPGDKLMKSLTNELIGRVETVGVGSVQTITCSPTKINIATNDYVHVYPKFEIVRIDFIGDETYTRDLISVNTKSTATGLPDLDTWSQNTVSDFGTVAENGVIFGGDAMPRGTTIEGRWKYVLIDCSDASSATEAAICYLKASPTIM